MLGPDLGKARAGRARFALLRLLVPAKAVREDSNLEVQVLCFLQLVVLQCKVGPRAY